MSRYFHTLPVDATILDGLSATLPLSDYGSIARDLPRSNRHTPSDDDQIFPEGTGVTR
jgi:hypothetical protein